MITASKLSGKSDHWQAEAAAAISDPAELIRVLKLPDSLLAPAKKAAAMFPLRVPLSYVRRMRRGDPADPLLLQVLPLQAEMHPDPDYVRDPVGDIDALSGPGVLQKYAGRALLITTGACAVHCRYCFRRHFPYAKETAARDRYRPALATIGADTSIREVILSGGDPLSLGDHKLAALVRDIEAIPHVRRLRLHTRTPVVLPSRVDSALLGWLTACRLQKVIVIHCNHPNEIDAPLRDALRRLAATGARLLNQSVLLAGVNDSAPVLADLSEALFDAGVLPYYLHALDPVAGAAHFDLPESRAIALHRELLGRLPGYLVPRLVREIPGAAGKTPLIQEHAADIID